MEMFQATLAQINKEYDETTAKAREIITQAEEVKEKKLAALELLRSTFESLGSFEQNSIITFASDSASEDVTIAQPSTNEESKELPMTKKVEAIILESKVGGFLSTLIILEQVLENIPEARDKNLDILKVKIAKVLRKLEKDKVVKLVKVGGRGEGNIFQKQKLVESVNKLPVTISTLPFESSNGNGFIDLSQPENKISKFIGRLGEGAKKQLKLLINAPDGLNDADLCESLGFKTKIHVFGAIARILKMAKEEGFDPDSVIKKSLQFDETGKRVNHYSIGETVKDELKKLL